MKQMCKKKWLVATIGVLLLTFAMVSVSQISSDAVNTGITKPKIKSIAVNKAKTKAIVRWKKVKNAKKYQIFVKKNKKKYKRVKTVKKSKTKAVIKIAKNNTYKIKVRVIGKNNKKALSKAKVLNLKPIVFDEGGGKPTPTPISHSHNWDTYGQVSSTQHQVYCSDCWDYKLENHKMGEWIVTTPAVSYDPYSYESRYCSLCGYEETRRVYVSNPGSYNPNPGGGNDDNGFTEEPDENDIAFDLPNDFELYTGDIKQVTPDFNVSSSDIEYSSSNPNVATIDSNGYITGKGKGTATITATYKKNRSISDSCKVTVKDMTISLSDYSMNLKALPKGCPESYSNDWKKTITVNKTGIDNRVVRVRSANENIARCKNSYIDNNNQFEVQAVGSGETTIEVYVKAKKTYSNGEETTTNDKVLKTLTVKNTLLDVPVNENETEVLSTRNKIYIGQRPSSQYVYQYPSESSAVSSSEIVTTIKPTYATNWNASYESNDTSILTVDSQGNVTPKKEGKTTIDVTITDCDGKTFTKTSSPIRVKKIAFFEDGSQSYAEGGVLKEGYEQLSIWRENPENWWKRKKDGDIYYLKNLQGYMDLTIPLIRNTTLERGAMQRAKEAHEKFSHTRPDGSASNTVYTVAERNALKPGGEILCFGSSFVTPEEMIKLYAEEDEDYNGQGHRRIMLDTYSRQYGVGCYYKNGKTTWCVHYSDVAP